MPKLTHTRRAITLAELNHLTININCHRSRRPYGASVELSMFSFSGVSAEKIGPSTTPKEWRLLNYFFPIDD